MLLPLPIVVVLAIVVEIDDCPALEGLSTTRGSTGNSLSGID